MMRRTSRENEKPTPDVQGTWRCSHKRLSSSRPSLASSPVLLPRRAAGAVLLLNPFSIFPLLASGGPLSGPRGQQAWIWDARLPLGTRSEAPGPRMETARPSGVWGGGR
eukprot:7171211-Pyramimonas_sp.AAC.1